MEIKKDRNLGFLSNSIMQLVCVIWAIGQIYPIFWLILSTFKQSSDIRNHPLSFPTYIYLDNYNLAAFINMDIRVDLYIRNSLIIATISLLVLTIITLFAGYAIAKMKVPAKNFIIIMLIILLAIPMHSIILPLYYLMSKLNLLNNYFGLILPYIAINVPFSVLLLQTFFRQLPDELIEAAKIDGCSNIRTFLSIILPISKGGIAAVLIINFINIWNELLLGLLIMKSNSGKTIPVGILLFKDQYNMNWGGIFAVLAISLLPPMIIYIIFHRNIIKGLTSGAIKG